MRSLAQLLKTKKPKSIKLIAASTGQEINIDLSYNKRAKRFILRQNTSNNGFKVTMPPRTTVAQAKSFCIQHLNWMQTRLSNQGEIVSFKHGQTIRFKDAPLELVFLEQLRGHIDLQTQQGVAQVLVPGGTDFAPRRLVTWLKAAAKTDILQAIQKYQPLLNVKHSKLTIRDTKSRWGSCSSSKALSFSWRLIMAPPDVLDYVVAHELAHILEMNHSAKFWQHVSDVCPTHKTAQNWLKLNGGKLHQVRVK